MDKKGARVPIKETSKKKPAHTLQTPHLTIKCIKNETNTTARIAVVLKKGVSKKAVERNKLKRKTQASLDKIKKNIPSYDYIVILKKNPKPEKKETIQQELNILTTLK
jgi:ribonuclease P protein component